MSEKVSHWAAAISAVVACVAFVVSIIKYWDDVNKEKVEDWQKVAVYEYILDKGNSHFRDIKVGYITEAQQIDAFSIPTHEIQDESLRKILMDLQANNLIIFKETGEYSPILATFQPTPRDMMELLNKRNHLMSLYPIVKIRVLDILNRECGKINQDELYREVTESVDIEAPIFIDMLHSMRGAEVHKLDDDTWCTTYDSEKTTE